MKEPFKKKLKIVDNDDLREELIGLFNNQDKNLLLDFALRIIDITFDKISYDYLKNTNVKQVLLNFSSWRKKEIKLNVLRKEIFKIHELAKHEEDQLIKTALRVLGHALATAHTTKHLIVSTDYLIKLINIMSSNNYEESTKIRHLQIGILKGLITEKQKV
jgi:hypothetical protein